MIKSGDKRVFVTMLAAIAFYGAARTYGPSVPVIGPYLAKLP